MLLYPAFYRKLGVRRVDQMYGPPKYDIKLMEMPRESIVHYTGDDTVEVGPPLDYYLLRNVGTRLLTMHYADLQSQEGNPRLTGLNVETKLSEFGQQRRRYTRIRDMRAMNGALTQQGVMNYAPIDLRYKYNPTPLTAYYKWYNKHVTIWKGVARTAVESTRHQFIEVRIPEKLPGLSDLTRAADMGMTPAFFKIFDTPEKLFFLEFWKWLGPHRKSSMLSVVGKDQLDRVNLLFTDAGRFFVVNLKVLDSFRVPMPDEASLYKGEKIAGNAVPPIRLAQYALRGFMQMLQTRGRYDLPEDEQDLSDEETADKTDIIVATKDEATGETVYKEVGPNGEIGDIVDPLTVAEAVSKSKRTGKTTVKIVGKDNNPLNELDNLEDIDIDAIIDSDLAQLEEVNKRLEETELVQSLDPITQVVPEVFVPDTPEDKLMAVCEELAEQGYMSPADIKRFERLASTYKTMDTGTGKTLAELVQIKPEALVIKDEPPPKIEGVLDQAIAGSTLKDFDQKYVKEVMQADIAAMVLNLQKGGVAITAFQVERKETALGAYDAYSIRIVPADGVPSTIHFRIPVVDEDGNFTVNGVKYKLRKQIGVHMPIERVSDTQVSLTSYYGKLFISRSAKKVDDYSGWLARQIKLKDVTEGGKTVFDVDIYDAYEPAVRLPKVYTSMAKSIGAFKLRSKEVAELVYEFSFAHKNQGEFFGADAVAKHQKDGLVLIAKFAFNQYLLMDFANQIYRTTETGLEPIGTIESLLELDYAKAPVEFVEIGIMGKDIPVGFILAYLLGLNRFMARIKPTVRRAQTLGQAKLRPNEYALTFSDEVLVFNKDEPSTAIFLAGLAKFNKILKQYTVHDFNSKAVYHNLLEGIGISTRFLNELDMLQRLFVDPITKELLVDMKEPTEFDGLLQRAGEILLTDYAPQTKGRVRGYERFAGAIYTEMVRALRVHNGKAGRSRNRVDLHPYAVWTAITTDPAKQQLKEINPIEDIRQGEAMTYNGNGGRSTDSMTKETRKYKKVEEGLTSEATVDSGQVGVNVSTSANPKFNSVRGTYDTFELGKDDPSRLVSTSCLLSPGSDRDDPRRVNFVSIQHAHGISCVGYQAPVVRTGYEQVLAHRTSDLFAKTARDAGKVVSVKPTGIIVEFADGTRQGYELGIRFGNAASLTIPHSVVTRYKEGDTFKKGDILVYNEDFFEPDFLNPRGVCWKSGIPSLVGVLEDASTYEDSCSISRKLAEKMATRMSPSKWIVLNFDQAIHDLVKVGQTVKPEDIACIIEEATTAGSTAFGEDQLNALRLLGAQSPRIGHAGKVERIVVWYNGDKENMSDSVRELVTIPVT